MYVCIYLYMHLYMSPGYVNLSVHIKRVQIKNWGNSVNVGEIALGNARVKLLLTFSPFHTFFFHES